MQGLLSQLRYTVRLVLKSPGFTITAVLILGVGIGANTAVFSLIKGVLLQPLPYPQADRLVEIFQPLRNLQTFQMAYPDYEDFRANQQSFQDLALILLGDKLSLTGQGDPARIGAAFVTGNFFKTLGRPLILGRPFSETEDNPGAPAVAILGERLWRTRFHADPQIVGTRLILSGTSFQVIGVTPQQADETGQIGVYAPLHLSSAFQQLKTDRASHAFQCIGRLKDGVTLQQAQADLEVTSGNLATQYPETHATVSVRLVPLLDSVVGDYASTLLLLGAAVTFLLFIACANVAGLHLARSLERRKEMTIRVSLGASRGHLVLQLLVENTILSLAGGVAGIVFACWAITAVRLLSPEGAPRFDEVSFDGVAFVLILFMTLLISFSTGLFPTLALSKVDLSSALRGEGTFGGTGGPQRQRTQSVLVICQVVLASLLLFGCGLLARSFQAMQNVSLGFNPNHVLTANIYLPDTKYQNEAQCKAFFDVVIAKIRQIPGVTAAGTTDALPFANGDDDYNAGPFGIVGQPDPDRGHRPRSKLQIVSPEYFKTLEIPLLRGRGFDTEYQLKRDRIVIVNQALAETHFPGQDPIGKQIHDFAELEGFTRTSYTIVGVVPTVRQQNPALQQNLFQAYFPYGQQHPYAHQQDDFCTLVLRTDGDPRLLLPAVQKVISSIDPDVPLSDLNTFESVISKTFEIRRLALLLVGLFSFFALTSSAVGVYGVLARLVSLRSRDIGIRIALGARVSDVIGLVFWQGLKIVCVGLVFGTVIALVLGRFLTGLVYGISSSDPATMGLVVLVLSLAALLACLLPALRATRINPIVALRE